MKPRNLSNSFHVFFVMVTLAATVLYGCSRMQESFLTVQICLVDQAGVIKFKDFMRKFAVSEGLDYIDNSARQRVNLEDMGADKHPKVNAEYAIDLHLEGNNGMGLTAGNLGLPPYQVALGITEGADAPVAHQVSDRLLAAMNKRWHTQIVPEGAGALPMETCRLR